jgi:hypothetical protein
MEREIEIKKVYNGDRVYELPRKGHFTVSAELKLSKEECIKLMDALVEGDETPIRLTKSVCPECYEEKRYDQMLIPAAIVKHGEEVHLRKECKKHGRVEERYWESDWMFIRAMSYADQGIKLETFETVRDPKQVKCPLSCGLCVKHKSHTALANMVVTNRCHLSCWYCFFYAREGGHIYEPSLEDVKRMLKVLKSQKPIAPNAIQLTGGEPTMRADLPEIIKLCRKFGFDHVQLNTTGINLAKDAELTREVVEAGANVLYVSFDGVTPKTNPKNYWEVPQALENVRKAKKAGVVLVPTVINGVNDHELGDIIRFAAGNIDVVRGVNFQPVSLVGRMPKKERERMRITIPKACKRIEEQLGGQIEQKDFYPIPCVASVTNFIEALTGRKQYRLSTHFACGSATYVFFVRKKLIPITRFIDVEGLFEYLNGLAEEIKCSKVKPLAKVKVSLKIALRMNRFIDKEKMPKDLKLKRALVSALTSKNYDGLRQFHYQTLFIGMMHFQDPYNYDVDRVQRCTIHYVTPAGTVIPFCAFNVLPELYRDRLQERFAVPVEEWEKRTGRTLKEEKYVRRYTEEEKKRIDEFYKKSISAVEIE